MVIGLGVGSKTLSESAKDTKTRYNLFNFYEGGNLENMMKKEQLPDFLVVLEKEKIRDRYQALLLAKGANIEEVLSQYKNAIVDFVHSSGSEPSEAMFEMPVINLPHTLATKINPQYIGLDLVSISQMAEKTLKSKNLPFHIESDTVLLKRLAQNFVNKNNQEAEVSLSASMYHTNDLMISYASKEQELVDLYRYLLLEYQQRVQTPLDQNIYKLALYFDNYFVDFEENLKDLDKGISATAHPYYMKIFRTTQDKLSVIYRVYKDNIRELNLRYIDDKKAYTALQHEKQKYSLEYEMLLSEFHKYATLFLNAYEADTKEFETFDADYKQLTARFK